MTTPVRLARALLVATPLMLAATAAWGETSYSLLRLGFTDAAHTGPNGEQYSSAYLLSDSGIVVGESTRFDSETSQFSLWMYQNGVTTEIGLTNNPLYVANFAQEVSESGDVYGEAWITAGSGIDRTPWHYANGTTTRIGFYDGPHTSASGISNSEIRDTNSSGQRIGYSTTYNGNAQHGSSAWLYSGGTLIRLGYTDATHTLSDGSQSSDAYFINDAGQVAGTSRQSTYGDSAWLYSNGTLTRVGYYDAQHTRTNGFQQSFVRGLNEVGQVVGTSWRANGSYNGETAWIYSDGAMTRLGYWDATHTRSANGEQMSQTGLLNDSGQVTGISQRYITGQSSFIGNSAWLYTHSTGVTVRLGYTDAAHTSSIGAQNSSVSHLTNSGYVFGASSRYSGTAATSASTWIYKEGVTTRIGLFDATHTSSTGEQSTLVGYVTESGRAAGRSRAFLGTSTEVQSGWVYNGSTSVRVGLYDGVHVNPNHANGFHTWVRGLNEAGQAAGMSERYTSYTPFVGDGMSWSAWFYDPDSNATIPLIFSVQTGTGHATSWVKELSEDGTVSGFFEKYDGATHLGRFNYTWSLAEGFHEISANVHGGIAQYGLTALQISRANAQGQAIAYGTLANGNYGAYLLNPLGGGAWNSAVGGTWSNGGNWSFTAAPKVTDDAVFSLADTYQVHFTDNGTAHGVTVNAGHVMLVLGGHTLTVANGVNINGGTLNVNGALAGNVNVATNGRLAGQAAINGNLVNAGTLTAGATSGRIVVTGDVTLANSAKLEFELGSSQPLIDVQGTLIGEGDGTYTVLFSAGEGITAGSTFTLISSENATEIDASRFKFDTLATPWLAGDFLSDAAGLQFHVTAAPEPAMLGVMSLIGMSLLRRTRRTSHP